jgi:tetratricopeptide (TPR) repeat protein
MAFIRSGLSLRSGTVKVLLFSVTLTALIFSGSAIYYNHLNSLEDPRLFKAQEYHKHYTQAVDEQEYETALAILDAWEKLFLSIPGYAASYERGVLNNNRGSIYIIKFETEVLVSNDSNFKPPFHYLEQARIHILKSIQIYEAWLEKWQYATEGQLAVQIDESHSSLAINLDTKTIAKIKAKRLEELKLAQIETPRRLSVSLTNYGVIKRYSGDLAAARDAYDKALALWDLNYTAKDNLAVLKGDKPQKRTIINKLFPPERE